MILAFFQPTTTVNCQLSQEKKSTTYLKSCYSKKTLANLTNNDDAERQPYCGRNTHIEMCVCARRICVSSLLLFHLIFWFTTTHIHTPNVPKWLIYWTSIYMPNLYFPWAQTAYLYACVTVGPLLCEEAKPISFSGVNRLFSGNCLGHASSLTSLYRKSRKGWCYFVSNHDLAKGCQTRSFFSNEGSRHLPAFT